jgi:hypothetical protein
MLSFSQSRTAISLPLRNRGRSLLTEAGDVAALRIAVNEINGERPHNFYLLGQREAVVRSGWKRIFQEIAQYGGDFDGTPRLSRILTKTYRCKAPQAKQNLEHVLKDVANLKVTASIAG